MQDTSRLLRIKSRLQMMYGSCKVISNEAALVWGNGGYRLFNIANGGAKEIDSGSHYRLYDDMQVLAMGYDLNNCLNLYTLEGKPWRMAKCTGLTKLSDDILGISGTHGESHVISSTGEPIVKSPLLSSFGHDNGILNLMANTSTFIYSTKSKKVITVPREESRRQTINIAVSFSLVYIYKSDGHYEDGTIGTVYDTDLNEYDKIIEYHAENARFIQLGTLSDEANAAINSDKYKTIFTLMNKKEQTGKRADIFCSARDSLSVAERWNSIQSLV